LVDGFKAGDFPVLVNCALLTEGADIPNIDCVVIARPTRSRNVFLQMIGRGMRLSPNTGKQDCRVIDFVDSTNRVIGIVNAPTLLGLDPEAALDGISIQELDMSADVTSEELSTTYPTEDHRLDVPDPKSVTYVDYDNPFVLFDQRTGASPHIVQLSKNAWVDCGEGIHVLECLGKGHIRIEPIPDDSGDHFHAHYTPTIDPATASALSISRFQTNRKILDANNLADAVRGCDKYASEKVLRGHSSLSLARSARWRQGPASAAQKLFVAKRWGYANKSVQDFWDPSDDDSFPERLKNLTKGEAAYIITRLRHGALRRYTKKIAARRKLEAAQLKEKQRQAREHVRVGPLAPFLEDTDISSRRNSA